MNGNRDSNPLPILGWAHTLSNAAGTAITKVIRTALSSQDAQFGSPDIFLVYEHDAF
jgi:hypothetical protein